VGAISAKPLGSAGFLHHHFRFKETFAREVLDRYFAGTREFVKQALDDTSLTPGGDRSGIWTLSAADRKWNLVA
jgi:hypothetical protein